MENSTTPQDKRGQDKASHRYTASDLLGVAPILISHSSDLIHGPISSDRLVCQSVLSVYHDVDCLSSVLWEDTPPFWLHFQRET